MLFHQRIRSLLRIAFIFRISRAISMRKVRLLRSFPSPQILRMAGADGVSVRHQNCGFGLRAVCCRVVCASGMELLYKIWCEIDQRDENMLGVSSSGRCLLLHYSPSSTYRTSAQCRCARITSAAPRQRQLLPPYLPCCTFRGP